LPTDHCRVSKTVLGLLQQPKWLVTRGGAIEIGFSPPFYALTFT